MFWGRGVRRAAMRCPRSGANASLRMRVRHLPRWMRCARGSRSAMQDIRNGLAQVQLPARFQVLPGRPTVVLDVAHNPQAARVLAEKPRGMGFYPETYGVFGMLRDKDIEGVCRR